MSLRESETLNTRVGRSMDSSSGTTASSTCKTSWPIDHDRK
jgi:hypothetical protein